MTRNRAWVISGLLLLAACGSGGQDAQKAGPGGGRGPGGGTPEVGFVVVKPGAVPLTAELTGRTSAFATSEVRPQVSGILQSRQFTEGSMVRAGQTLYQIDPSIYRAGVNQASANLASAQASAEAAKAKADRYAPLAKIQAVSEQDYTDAAAQARQARAAVQQTSAALDSARINLRFTRVPAPITGRIGRSLVTQGALVTANQTDPLAVIQQLDPIYVDIQQSSADMITLRRQITAGGNKAGSAVVHIKLEDGSDYPLAGTIEFSEVMVDTSTGTVTLRARFPNPDGLLLPGMFVRASFTQSVDPDAFLVPQPGVNRDPRGGTTVLVVGAGNKVELRKVRADRTEGANWVVTDGLKPGDRVIVEGTAKARPGQTVKPVPAGSPQRLGPGGPGGPGGGRRHGPGGGAGGANGG
jgi:membrane fusion protein (multidrug efflux system)